MNASWRRPGGFQSEDFKRRPVEQKDPHDSGTDLFLSKIPLFLPSFAVRHAVFFSLLTAFVVADASAADGVAFFESSVRPLLVKHCYECHSQESGNERAGCCWIARKAGESAVMRVQR
jgi:hypothetical protein